VCSQKQQKKKQARQTIKKEQQVRTNKIAKKSKHTENANLRVQVMKELGSAKRAPVVVEVFNVAK